MTLKSQTFVTLILLACMLRVAAQDSTATVPMVFQGPIPVVEVMINGKGPFHFTWRNVDVCAQENIDRANPDFSKYMSLETKLGQKRVCWNSWIAPHNYEGFYLNMGDMLVKAGDWQTAEKLYANAKLSREYGSWKFQDVLEDRINEAQSNVAPFKMPNETSKPKMMINSEFSCMACHQQ